MSRRIDRYEPGDVVVLRGLGRAKIWYALPVIVVTDRSDLLALFWRAGTAGKWRLKSPETKVSPADVIHTQMDLIDRTWTGTDVLMLVPPGEAHAVYVMWEAGQTKMNGWYINLQEPVRRTAIGFDTQDHWLDIVVAPDRAAWRWKDEDQLQEAVSFGIVSEECALAIRAEGERVIQKMNANQSPFCDGWEHWQASPDWKIPSLPKDWDADFLPFDTQTHT